jgi:SPP1 family predicted phage head-tail adaptor
MKKESTVSKFPHKISILINKSENELFKSKWEEFCVCFAEIKPVSDNKFISLEGVSFGNVITEEYFYFRTRFVKGITKEMRISFQGRDFEIKRIIDDNEKGRMLSIIALEV